MGAAKYYKFKKDITESGMHRAQFKQVARYHGQYDIDDFMFSGNSSVTRIIVQDGTSRLEMSAFIDCPSLKEVILPSSLETVYFDIFSGYGTFHGCNSLEKVVFFEYPKMFEDFYYILTDEVSYDDEHNPKSAVLMENLYIYIPDEYVDEKNAEIKANIEQSEAQGITFVNKRDVYFKPLSEL